MDPSEYVDARWSALVRAAVLLGASEAEAPDLVRSVLAANARRIRRSDDPDELVHEALAAAVPGSERSAFGAEQSLDARRDMLAQADPDNEVAPPAAGPVLPPPRRRWRIGAALVALAVLGALTFQAARGGSGPDHPPPPADALGADQVPSLFGYDADAARALLRRRGLDVTVHATRACEVMGRVVGSEPGTGSRLARGDDIVVFASVPSDVSCLGNYSDLEDAWTFLDFVNGRGPAPATTEHVRVFVDGAERPEPTRTSPVTLDRNSASVRDPVRAAMTAVHRIGPTYVTAALTVSRGVPPASTCGVARPARLGDRPAISLTIQPPAASTTSCPLRVDLYRSGERLTAVAVYGAQPGE